MVFNSMHFLWYFLVVTTLYFIAPHRSRWMLLLVASCYFYATLIPKYLLVLAALIAIDYVAGILIEDAKGWRRRGFLYASLAANLGLLFFFKYFDFFGTNWNALAQKIGWNYSVPTLALILPLGISFHTFQSMGYTIEVYLGRQKAERHLGIYSLYVLFYPQLVAGPIERPQHLLPQFRTIHRFDSDRITAGLRLMLWGFLKKVAIADQLSLIANPVFGNVHAYSGWAIWGAVLAFTFQIYCDFSGYSDIAIGSARVMGFDLRQNFRQPYLATSISDFWQRWHISLSLWFRDYVYIPLGGNRVSPARRGFNVMAVFLLSGFWHGANWTFLAWGALHGMFNLVSLQIKRNRGSTQPFQRTEIAWFAQVLSTFTLVAFAWIFFRANSIAEAGYLVTHLFDFHSSSASAPWTTRPMLAMFLMGIVWLVEWKTDRNTTGFEISARGWVRWMSYTAIALAIVNLGVSSEVPFIYFQF